MIVLDGLQANDSVEPTQITPKGRPMISGRSAPTPCYAAMFNWLAEETDQVLIE